MPFQKGHPPMGGRPKKIKTQVKDFIKEHPYAVETLMKTLYDMGIEGDREAAVYIIDRIKGRPSQSIDQRITGQVTITPDMRKLAVMYDEIDAKEEQKLLKEEDAIQGQINEVPTTETEEKR